MSRYPHDPARRSVFPTRLTNNRTETAAVVVILVSEDVSLDVAEGGVGLVLDAVVDVLDAVFLELRRARERDGSIAAASSYSP